MEEAAFPSCPKCNTPLDEKGTCVTCAAEEAGLALLTRSSFPAVREMMSLLEVKDFAPEMERVPPRRPEEMGHPLWNLYVPSADVERAFGQLRADWSELLEDPNALAAADRGARGIDLDAGGEIECPACGTKFTLTNGHPECPDCGLELGAPSDAAPDETE
jgi:hypothetical protein